MPDIITTTTTNVVDLFQIASDRNALFTHLSIGCGRATAYIRVYKRNPSRLIRQPNMAYWAGAIEFLFEPLS